MNHFDRLLANIVLAAYLSDRTSEGHDDVRARLERLIHRALESTPHAFSRSRRNQLRSTGDLIARPPPDVQDGSTNTSCAPRGWRGRTQSREAAGHLGTISARAFPHGFNNWPPTTRSTFGGRRSATSSGCRVTRIGSCANA